MPELIDPENKTLIINEMEFTVVSAADLTAELSLEETVIAYYGFFKGDGKLAVHVREERQGGNARFVPPIKLKDLAEKNPFSLSRPLATFLSERKLDCETFVGHLLAAQPQLPYEWSVGGIKPQYSLNGVGWIELRYHHAPDGTLMARVVVYVEVLNKTGGIQFRQYFVSLFYSLDDLLQSESAGRKELGRFLKLHKLSEEETVALLRTHATPPEE